MRQDLTAVRATLHRYSAQRGVHSPPFCTYCLTNSSLFSSSTSSISSRSESTSSVISLWRSAVSVSTEASTSSVSSRVRVAFCCPPVSLVAMACPPVFGTAAGLKLPSGGDISAPPDGGFRSGAGDRVDQLLRRQIG